MNNNHDEHLRTAGEKAYQTLLHAILENKLESGVFLSQRKLASYAGTSIVSLREALKQLEHEGIIEAVPRWGVRLPKPTRERLIEVYQVREGLEVMVASLLAQETDEDVKEKLYALAVACDELEVSDEQSIVEFSNRHRELHLSMAESTGNQQLQKYLDRIGLRMIIYQSARSTWFHQRENWDYWHQGLLDEIFSGDVSRARTAMHSHIQNGLKNDLILFDEKNMVKE